MEPPRRGRFRMIWSSLRCLARVRICHGSNHSIGGWTWSRKKESCAKLALVSQVSTASDDKINENRASVFSWLLDLTPIRPYPREQKTGMVPDADKKLLVRVSASRMGQVEEVH